MHPGCSQADACGAPFLTTAVLMFTSMSVVQFWKSAPSISEEAKAFVDVVSEYSFPPPPPRLTRDAKDFFMMEYCATLQAQGRSYNKMSHVAFQEEVDRMWKVQEESGDTRKWCDMATAAQQRWGAATRGPLHAHVKNWSKQVRRPHPRPHPRLRISTRIQHIGATLSGAQMSNILSTLSGVSAHMSTSEPSDEADRARTH